MTDTAGATNPAGEVSMEKVPPLTGLEDDEDAATRATSDTDPADPDVTTASDASVDAEVTDRELGIDLDRSVPPDAPDAPDAPVAATFVEGP